MKRITLEEEYEKHKNIRPEDVKNLMDWAKKQPHLPPISELESLMFLIAYNGSIEQSKSLVDIYYTARTHSPEFYDDRNLKSLEKDMDVVLLHASETHRVFYAVYIDTDPANYNMVSVLKIAMMIFDTWLLRNGSAEDYHMILDMKGVQFGHVVKLSMNLVTAKKALYYIQETITSKIGKIHIVNVISLIDKIMIILKPFMKPELYDKIIFHKNGIEDLKKYICIDHIPQNLGGNGPTLSEMHESMKKILYEEEDYFNEEIKKVDESKRPGKPKTSGDLFGIEGSFKKLEID